MALINSVVLVGNLTRDAEIRYTNSGTASLRFSIAQNRRKKQGEQWVDEAQYFDISMMGKAAEAVHRFLTKGKQVAVQGEIRQDRWEQEGQSKSKIYVFALSLQLLGGGSGESRGPAAPQNQGPAGGNYDNFGSSSDEHFDDDIPF